MKKISGIIMALSLMTIAGGAAVPAYFVSENESSHIALPSAAEEDTRTFAEKTAAADALAESNGWAKITTGIYTKSGTHDNIHSGLFITSAEGLAYVAKRVSIELNTAWAAASIELGCDIDLSGRIWTPIGVGGDADYQNYNTFKGEFNGNGYTISGMWTVDSAYPEDRMYPSYALFGWAENAKIYDIVLTAFPKLPENTAPMDAIHSASLAAVIKDSTFASIYDLTGQNTFCRIGGNNTYYEGGLYDCKELDYLHAYVNDASSTLTKAGTVATFDADNGLYYGDHALRSKNGTYKVLSDGTNPFNAETFGTTLPGKTAVNNGVYLKKKGYRTTGSTGWYQGDTSTEVTTIAQAKTLPIVKAKWNEIKYTFDVMNGSNKLTTITDVAIDSDWKDQINKIVNANRNFDLLTATIDGATYYNADVRYDDIGNRYIKQAGSTWAKKGGGTTTNTLEIDFTQETAAKDQSNLKYLDYGLGEIVLSETASQTYTVNTTWQAQLLWGAVKYNYADGKIPEGQSYKSVSIASSTGLNSLESQNGDYINFVSEAGKNISFTFNVPFGYEITSVGTSDGNFDYENVVYSGSLDSSKTVNVEVHKISKEVAINATNCTASISYDGGTTWTAITKSTESIKYGSAFLIKFEANKGYVFPVGTAIDAEGIEGGTTSASSSYSTTELIMNFDSITWTGTDAASISATAVATDFNMNLTQSGNDYSTEKRPLVELSNGETTTTFTAPDFAINKFKNGESISICIPNSDYYAVETITLTAADGSQIALTTEANPGSGYQAVYTFNGTPYPAQTLTLNIVWAKKTYTAGITATGATGLPEAPTAGTVYSSINAVSLKGTPLPGVELSKTSYSPEESFTAQWTMDITTEYYEFKGWYYSNKEYIGTGTTTTVDGKKVNTIDIAGRAQNDTIWAVFAEKTATINFANGNVIVGKDGKDGYTSTDKTLATVSNESTIYTHGTDAFARSITATVATGYSFEGWYVRRGSEGSYTYRKITEDAAISSIAQFDGFDVNSFADVVIVPVVAQKTITLSFDANEGTWTNGTPSDITVYFDQEGTFTLPTATKTGYADNGWTLTGGADIPAATAEITYASVYGTGNSAEGNRVLTKKWSANSYILTFDYTGVEAKTVYYDAAIGTLPVPTKTGYTFIGWTIDEETITAETVWAFAESKTAVATWSANTYTIAINMNGSKQALPTAYPIEVKYGEAITLEGLKANEYGEAWVPTRPGYTFNGWKIGRNASSLVEFTDGTILNIDNFSDATFGNNNTESGLVLFPMWQYNENVYEFSGFNTSGSIYFDLAVESNRNLDLTQNVKLSVHGYGLNSSSDLETINGDSFTVEVYYRPTESDEWEIVGPDRWDGAILKFSSILQAGYYKLVVKMIDGSATKDTGMPAVINSKYNGEAGNDFIPTLHFNYPDIEAAESIWIARAGRMLGITEDNKRENGRTAESNIEALIAAWKKYTGTSNDIDYRYDAEYLAGATISELPAKAVYSTSDIVSSSSLRTTPGYGYYNLYEISSEYARIISKLGHSYWPVKLTINGEEKWYIYDPISQPRKAYILPTPKTIAIPEGTSAFYNGDTKTFTFKDEDGLTYGITTRGSAVGTYSQFVNPEGAGFDSNEFYLTQKPYGTNNYQFFYIDGSVEILDTTAAKTINIIERVFNDEDLVNLDRESYIAINGVSLTLTNGASVVFNSVANGTKDTTNTYTLKVVQTNGSSTYYVDDVFYFEIADDNKQIKSRMNGDVPFLTQVVYTVSKDYSNPAKFFRAYRNLPELEDVASALKVNKAAESTYTNLTIDFAAEGNVALVFSSVKYVKYSNLTAKDSVSEVWVALGETDQQTYARAGFDGSVRSDWTGTVGQNGTITTPAAEDIVAREIIVDWTLATPIFTTNAINEAAHYELDITAGEAHATISNKSDEVEYSYAWSKVAEGTDSYTVLDVNEVGSGLRYLVVSASYEGTTKTAVMPINITFTANEITLNSFNAANLVYSKSDKMGNISASFTGLEADLLVASQNPYIQMTAYADEALANEITSIVNAGTYYIKIALTSASSDENFNGGIYAFGASSLDDKFDAENGYYKFAITVDQKALTIANITKVFDGKETFSTSNATHTATIEGIESGDVVHAMANFARATVGTDIAVSNLEVDNENYKIAEASDATGNITTYAIKVGGANGISIQKTYNGDTALAQTVEPFAGYPVVLTGTFASAETGKWTVSDLAIEGANSANYTLDTTGWDGQGDIFVSEKVGVISMTNTSFEYGEILKTTDLKTALESRLKVSAKADGSDLGLASLTITGISFKAVSDSNYSTGNYLNVGTYTIVISATTGNYQLENSGITEIEITITAKSLTVSNITKVFDRTTAFSSENANSSAAFTALAGDEVFVVGTFASATVADSIAFTYSDFAGADAANYTLNRADSDMAGSITIDNNTEISIALDKSAFEYAELTIDENGKLVGAAYSVLADGQDVSAYISVDSITINSGKSTGGYAKAGNWSITFEISSDNYANANDSRVISGVVVKQATLTVSVKQAAEETTSITKAYDKTTNLPSDVEFVINQKSGDDVVISGSYDNANIGSGKTINLVKSGADADSYSISYAFTGEITANGISITRDFSKVNFVDGTQAAENDTITLSVSNQTTGEMVMSAFGTPAAKTGYDFEGWYSDENLENKITAENVVELLNLGESGNIDAGIRTIYANWTIQNDYNLNVNIYIDDVLSSASAEHGFNISVNGDAVEEVRAGQGYIKNVEYYSNVVITAIDGNKKWFVFDHMTINEESNDAITAIINNVVDKATTINIYFVERDVKIQAIGYIELPAGSVADDLTAANADGWTRAGSIWTKEARVADKDAKLSAILPQLSLIGYDFAGWFTSQDFASSNAITDAISIESVVSADGLVVSIYAKFTPKTYVNAITLNANGGSFSDDTEQKQMDAIYGSILTTTAAENSITLPNNLTRSAYKFAGWEAKVGDAYYAVEGTVFGHVNGYVQMTGSGNDADFAIELYAKWVYSEYELTINADNATIVVFDKTNNQNVAKLDGTYSVSSANEYVITITPAAGYVILGEWDYSESIVGMGEVSVSTSSQSCAISKEGFTAEDPTITVNVEERLNTFTITADNLQSLEISGSTSSDVVYINKNVYTFKAYTNDRIVVSIITKEGYTTKYAISDLLGMLSSGIVADEGAQTLSISGFTGDVSFTLAVEVATFDVELKIASGVEITAISGVLGNKVEGDVRILTLQTGRPLVISIDVLYGFENPVANIIKTDDYTHSSVITATTSEDAKTITITGFTMGAFSIELSADSINRDVSAQGFVLNGQNEIVEGETIDISIMQIVGDDKVELVDGKAPYLSTVEFTATSSNEHFMFLGWFSEIYDEEGNVALQEINRLSVNETYRATISADLEIYAIYKYKSYNVKIQTANEEMGTVSYRLANQAAITEVVKAEERAFYNDSITLTPVAKPGFKFDHWENASGEVLSANADGKTLTTQITAEQTFIAIFAPESGTLNANVVLKINGILQDDEDSNTLDFARFAFVEWDGISMNAGVPAFTEVGVEGKKITAAFTTLKDMYLRLRVCEGYEKFSDILLNSTAISNKAALVKEYTEGGDTFFVFKFSNLNSSIDQDSSYTVEISAKTNNLTIRFETEEGKAMELAGKIYISSDTQGIIVSNMGNGVVYITALTGAQFNVQANFKLGFVSTTKDAYMVGFKSGNGTISNETLSDYVEGGTDEYLTSGYSQAVHFTASVNANSEIVVYVASRQYTVELLDRGTNIGTINNVYIGSPLNITPDLKATISGLSRNGYSFKGFRTLNNGQGELYINSDGTPAQSWNDNGYDFDGTTYFEKSYFRIENGERIFSLHADWDINKARITMDIIPDAIKDLINTDHFELGKEISMFTTLTNTNSYMDENNLFRADLRWGADLGVQAPEYAGYKFQRWEVSLDGQPAEGYNTASWIKAGGYTNNEILLKAIYHAEVKLRASLGGNATLVQGAVSFGNGESEYLPTTESFTLTAVPNHGFTFTGWFINGEETPISTDAEFVYNADAENAFGTMEIVAMFEGNPLTVSVKDADHNGCLLQAIYKDVNEEPVWTIGNPQASFAAKVGDTLTLIVYLADDYGIAWNISDVQLVAISDSVFTYEYTISSEDLVDDNILINPAFTSDKIDFYFDLVYDGKVIESTQTEVDNITTTSAKYGDISGQKEIEYGMNGSFNITTTANYKVKNIYFVNRDREDSLLAINIEEEIAKAQAGQSSAIYSALTYYDESTGKLDISQYEFGYEAAHRGTTFSKIIVVFAKDMWSENITISSVAGTGNANSPYLISNERELAFIADRINKGDSAYIDANYRLKQDINLYGKFWTPIGTTANPFNGTFDYAGYTIYGVSVDPDYAGETSHNGVFGVLGSGATFIEQGSSLVIIISAVVGALVLILLILLIVFLVRRKRKKQMEELANS